MDNVITSAQNAKVKLIVSLRDRRDRDRLGVFCIEGFRELTRAHAGRVAIQELFFCPELFLGENEAALIDSIRKQGAHITRCSEQVFRKISYRDRPDGLIAIASQMKKTLSDLAHAIKGVKNPLLVVAEAIEKPGNLGTILRTSDGAGAHGVIICDQCTDIYNPNVVRASVGTLFTLPVVEASSKEAIEWLKQQQIAIVSATPRAQASYTTADLAAPIAVALGTEQLGLSDSWMKQCDLQVRIPMQGVADSLNVAMAATILLFEAQRQRSL